MSHDALGEQFHEYRGQHQTWFEGASGAHEMHNAFPDYYEHPEWYHSRLNPNHPGYDAETRQYARDSNRAWDQTHNAVLAVRGKPKAEMDMYRAVPHGVTRIHQGDWVTPSEQYARIHAEGNLGSAGGHVLHARVQAEHLRNDGNYPPEFGYNGPDVEGTIR